MLVTSLQMSSRSEANCSRRIASLICVSVSAGGCAAKVEAAVVVAVADPPDVLIVDDGGSGRVVPAFGLPEQIHGEMLTCTLS